jgi:hypothetical protein
MANFTVHTVAQTLTDGEKAQARTNIGLPIAAGTVLANPSGVLANPVGVDAAGMRTLIGAQQYDETLLSLANLATPASTQLLAMNSSGSVVDGSAFAEVEVASVASLATTSVANGKTVSLKGYYATGDGGGQTLYYDSASSATVNGGTVFNGPGGVGRWLSLNLDVINLRMFGAKGDGVTNDTTAVQAAIDYCVTNGRTLYAPKGHYIATVTINGVFNRALQISGEADLGQNGIATVFEAVSNGQYAFTLNASRNIFHDVIISGSSKAKNGITCSDELSGHTSMFNCSIRNCNIGFYKPKGNYGCKFYNCSIELNNYGIYSRTTNAIVMHAGLDRLYCCNIRQNAKVGYYIDDNVHPAGTLMQDCVIESNGWGVFIQNYYSQGTFTLSRCWFENNGGTSVTVDHFRDGTTTTMTAEHIYVRNTVALKISEGTGIPSVVATGSIVTLDNQHISVVSKTDSSFVSIGGGTLDASADTSTLHLAPPKSFRDDRFAAVEIFHRSTVKAGNYGSLRNLYPIDLSLPYSGATFVPQDGVTTKGCASLTLSNTSITVIAPGSVFGITGSKKWKLATIAVKNASESLTLVFSYAYSLGSFVIPASSQWKTYALINTVDDTGEVTIYAQSALGAGHTSYFADVQVLEFASYQELASYLQSGLFISPQAPFTGYATSAPASGTWIRGDRVFNANAGTGTAKSWVCTSGGSPGTWVSEGKLETSDSVEQWATGASQMNINASGANPYYNLVDGTGTYQVFMAGGVSYLDATRIVTRNHANSDIWIDFDPAGDGLYVGKGSTRKLGFWGATPTTKPASVADATDAASVITQLNSLLAKLRTIGIIAT